MRQRTAMAGGTLDIQARPGHGTALVAHLPLSRAPHPRRLLTLGGVGGAGSPRMDDLPDLTRAFRTDQRAV